LAGTHPARQRDLAGREYVYVWVDGVHFNTIPTTSSATMSLTFCASGRGSAESVRREPLQELIGYRRTRSTLQGLLKEEGRLLGLGKGVLAKLYPLHASPAIAAPIIGTARRSISSTPSGAAKRICRWTRTRRTLVRFDFGKSVNSTDPLLDPAGLQNKGPTETIALQSMSPAIDVIPVSDCPATDQRRGVSITLQLQSLLGEAPIVSKNRRHAFFSLSAFAQALYAKYTPEQWEAERRKVLALPMRNSD
jgi:hypothetical protein